MLATATAITISVQYNQVWGDNIRGTDGEDDISGTHDKDNIKAGDGDDEIIGSGGDKIKCGEGFDTVYPSAEGDRIKKDCEELR